MAVGSELVKMYLLLYGNLTNLTLFLLYVVRINLLYKKDAGILYSVEFDYRAYLQYISNMYFIFSLLTT